MGFSFSDTFASASSGLHSLPVFNTVLSNAFYTAVLITICITLLYAWIYSTAGPGESGTTIALRGGFYTLLLVAGLILVRESVFLRQSPGGSHALDTSGNVLTNVPVTPQLGAYGGFSGSPYQPPPAPSMNTHYAYPLAQPQQQPQQQYQQQPQQFSPGPVYQMPGWVQNPVPSV